MSSANEYDVHDANISDLLRDFDAAADTTMPALTPSVSKAADSTSDIDRRHLEIPTKSSYRRRPSLESTYSDLSELSVYSGELRYSRPLVSDGAPRVRSLSPTPRLRGWRRTLSGIWIRNKGVVLVLSAQAFGCGMNVATRILETNGTHGQALHPFQILFARQSITSICSLGYGFYTHIPNFPFGPRNLLGLLITRGLSGFFGVFGLYFALLYLPLAEATVLTFLAPILTCYVCSFLIPGETFSRQQQLAAFVGLIGVVFIARPATLFHSPPEPPLTFNSTIPSNATLSTTQQFSQPTPPTPHQHFLAIAVSMLGVLGAVGAMSSIRMIGTRAHPLISVNYFSVWCTVVSLLAVVFVPSVGFRLPGNAAEWALLASLGACGFIMQFLLTAGLAYGGQSDDDGPAKRVDTVEGRSSGRENSSSRSSREKETRGSGTRATNMVYTQMLFALTFDKLIWGITPTWASWVGSGLILGSAVWVAVARDKDRSTQSPDVVVGADAVGAGSALASQGQKHEAQTDRKEGEEEQQEGLLSAGGQNHDRVEAGESSGSREALEMQDLSTRRGEVEVETPSSETEPSSTSSYVDTDV